MSHASGLSYLAFSRSRISRAAQAFGLVLVITIGLPVRATGQVPAAPCTQKVPVAYSPPCLADQGIRDFTVDARTGQINTLTHFGQTQLVRIVVLNVNPFLYSFDLAINAKPLNEASPADFFSALGIPVPSGDESRGQTPNVAIERENAVLARIVAAARDIADCPTDVPAKERSIYIDQSIRLASRKRQEARRIIFAMYNALRTADASYRSRQMVILDPESDISHVRSTAKEAATDLANASKRVLTESDNLGEPLDAIRRELTNLSGDIAQLKKEYPDCPTVVALQDSVDAFVRHSVTDTTEFTKLRDRYGTDAIELIKTATRIRAVANDPTWFYYTRLLSRYDSPTDVVVAVKRKTVATSDPRPEASPAQPQSNGQERAASGASNEKVSVTLNASIAAGSTSSPTKAEAAGVPRQQGSSSNNEFTTISEFVINFGGQPRFVVGVGITFTDIVSRTYPVIMRVKAPTITAPHDTLYPIIGDPTKSKGRITPMLSLNTRVADLNGRGDLDAAYITLGTGSRITGGADLDFLVGGALSMYNQRILLTGGAYFGRASVLAGGLRTGQRLPEGTGSVPTAEKMIVRPALAITYRVLPRR